MRGRGKKKPSFTVAITSREGKNDTCGPTTLMKHEIVQVQENQVGPPVSTNVEHSSLMAETVLTQNSSFTFKERYQGPETQKIERRGKKKPNQE